VDDQNRHVGFAKLTRDLTERKKAEETIREQNAELKATDEQLRRALEEREDFISVASHELKTPLTALSMQIESFDKTLRGALKTVESSGGQARRLSELLNELLDLTRIRIGRLTLDRHEMDLGSAVAEIAERLTRGTKAAGQVSVRVGERSVRGTWDSMRIGQVVTNLISNAVKYGDGKPIEVDISMDASNQQAELRVIDHGIGIPKETQGKVFERFERAAGVRKVTGLGLGLYITRQIVEAHGGTITVESEVGRGSTFTVRLPLQAASAAA
ncbi:MAG: ATP-binding protein, partial [Bdellovibrionota bacterium]